MVLDRASAGWRRFTMTPAERWWFLVGAELDVDAQGAPVAAELIGRRPRHHRVVAVAVDQHWRVGFVAPDALQFEPAAERLLVASWLRSS